MTMTKHKVTCGLYIPAAADLREKIALLDQDKSFSYIVVPLFHPGLDRCAVPYSPDRPASRSCRILESKDWCNSVVCEVSRHIDVDSADLAQRRRSEQLLEQELKYACYLDIRAVIVRLRPGPCSNLARILASWLAAMAHMQIWIQVPIENPQIAHESQRSDVLANRDHPSPWDWWNELRTFCDHHARLGVVLDVGPDLPPESDRARWLAEPVRAVLVRTSIFLTNNRKYPVLSRSHQYFLREFADIGTHAILAGPNRHESLGCYANYLNYVWNYVKSTEEASYDDPAFADFLQCPLQPLMNNLEAQTYEVFEKDPVKYAVYRDAMQHALTDRVSDNDKATVTTVLVVMGAGRGPLVQAALDAAEAADRLVRVYAVEKNPNAVITLQCRKEEEWLDRVTVIAGDMRRLKDLEKCDILVSELLGSFGDNELSPECLDGAQEFLKDDGISIPCDYTSYICPVMSHKLYSEARACAVEPGKPQSANLETLYVVLQKNKLFLDKPVPLFKFEHPNRAACIDNSRYVQCDFVVSRNCLVHGFSGFFHTTLYKQHILSIVPDTFSTGMFSWFPIYMPIARPVALQAGSTLTSHFWRCVGERDVWYEWTISAPEALPIHNVNGRSSKIGL